MIFNGKERANEILEDLKERIIKDKLNFKLAVISVGSDLASEIFIRNKAKAANEIGMAIEHFKFKDKVTDKEIIDKIESLNKDDRVQGIIVQLPLLKHLDTNNILTKINPYKDVDGFHKDTKFLPPLILAILGTLYEAVEDFNTKHIVAVVNSDFFGNVLRESLSKKNIKVEYLLNPKKEKPEDSLDVFKSKVKEADVIITVCGYPGLIKGDMVKEGIVLVDAGISVSEGKKIVGDIERESVENKAAFLTPVPGGIGPLTVAYLLENVYLAGIKQYNKD